jgi:hypothetical protein
MTAKRPPPIRVLPAPKLAGMTYDVLCLLDRLREVDYIYGHLNKPKVAVLKSLARLKRLGLADEFDGYWYRTPVGDREATCSTR